MYRMLIGVLHRDAQEDNFSTKGWPIHSPGEKCYILNKG